MRKCLMKSFLLTKEEFFFTDHTLKHIKVFNAMFNLHGKDKENLDKIDNFIKHSNEALERQNYFLLPYRARRLLTEFTCCELKIYLY